ARQAAEGRSRNHATAGDSQKLALVHAFPKNMLRFAPLW
ncbi:MAG: hypothetical protein RLZZ513_329, partial [Pseudomonadota bacterium]